MQNNALELGDFLVFHTLGFQTLMSPFMDGCEKNVVAANEKKTEPPSCVGKQNEVDQPVRKDQKHGINIETIDIESDSNTEPGISMISCSLSVRKYVKKNIRILEPENSSRSIHRFKFVCRNLTCNMGF